MQSVILTSRSAPTAVLSPSFSRGCEACSAGAARPGQRRIGRRLSWMWPLCCFSPSSQNKPQHCWNSASRQQLSRAGFLSSIERNEAFLVVIVPYSLEMNGFWLEGKKETSEECRMSSWMLVLRYFRMEVLKATLQGVTAVRWHCL